jgi:cold shock CspA family protein
MRRLRQGVQRETVHENDGNCEAFFEAKGFGFIARDDGQADLFFHMSGVAREFVETMGDAFNPDQECDEHCR